MVDGCLLVLSPWAVRNAALRRVAEPRLRLRRRLLPAGPRGRAQGGRPPTSRVVHHHSLELVARPRRCGSRRTSAWPRSGTAGCRATAPTAGLEGARPARRGRARGRARDRLLERARGRRAACWPLERELERADRRACRGGSPRRCARLNRLPRGASAPLVRRARGGSRPSRSPTASVAMPGAHGAAARAARRPRTRSTRAAAAARASWRARALLRRPQLGQPRVRAARGGGRGWPRAARAAGCGPSGSRIARERRPPTARRACQTTPKPKNAGTTARRRPSRRGDEVLDRGAARRCAGRPRAPPSAGRAARRGAARARRGRGRRPSPASGWRCSSGISSGAK